MKGFVHEWVFGYMVTFFKVTSSVFRSSWLRFRGIYSQDILLLYSKSKYGHVFTFLNVQCWFNGGKKGAMLNFWQISQQRIFMKFEAYAYNRLVDYQKHFGNDLCTHTFMPRAHMFLHETIQKLY